MSESPDGNDALLPSDPRPLPQEVAAKLRYEVMSMLAEGSLGRVWLAQDRSLRRVVALKELKPRLASNPEARARFLREAQITGGLEHPSIVPIYDLDLDEPFYAMRRIAGRTLSDLIDEYHRNPPKKRVTDTGLHRLLGAFLRICEAVAYANERGVVHRDLKPANVQVGDFGEVFVLDWGLAKVVGVAEAGGLADGDEPLTTEATVAGKVLGTPGYMAPEQAAGGAIDARTDVFGLGAILYKMVTGKAPHAHIQERSPEQFLLRVRTEPVPAARSVRAAVPAALEAICGHCLATDPAARYPNALLLADDVRRWLVGEPTTVYREHWTVRLARWGARHPALAQILAMFLLVGVVAATAFTLQVWKEDDQLAQIHLRELAGHADHMENTLRFELFALHGVMETNSRLPMLRALSTQMARPGASRIAADTLGRILPSVIRSRPVARRVSVVGPADGFRELVAAEAVGNHDAELVPPGRLHALAADPALAALTKRMQAEPDGFHLSPFLSKGDGIVFYAAHPLRETEPRLWLVLEINSEQLLAQMLAPIKRKGLAALLRNEEGLSLAEVALDSPSSETLSAAFADGNADPRLVQFLQRTDGDDVLALPSGQPGGDVILARKIAYDADDSAHRLDVILVSPREQLIRERTFDRRSAAILTILVLLGIAGMALVSSRFLARVAHVRD